MSSATERMSYLSCRALHSKIINKRRLMLKTNDVRISDCSLLLHASLKCVCPTTHHMPHATCRMPHARLPFAILQQSIAAFSFYATYFAQGASSSCGRSICIWDSSVARLLSWVKKKGWGRRHAVALALALNGKMRVKPFELRVAEPCSMRRYSATTLMKLASVVLGSPNYIPSIFN